MALALALALEPAETMAPAMAVQPPLMFQRVAVAKSMVTWTPQAVPLLVRSSLAVDAATLPNLVNRTLVDPQVSIS